MGAMTIQGVRATLPIWLLCAGLGGTAHGAMPPSCPAPQPESNMVTTLDSEFAKTGTLDRSQWRPFVGLHGGVKQELQAYVEREVKVSSPDGLVLQTDKEEFLGHPFISGEVTTEGLFSQTYGHFEMVAKMPQANGLWPAFWLLPADHAWPPEIDILEYIYALFGQLPDKNRHQASNPQTTLHWTDATGNHMQMGQGNHSDTQLYQTYEDWGSTPSPPGLASHYAGYHKYAVDWRPGSLVWFIDGSAVFCIIDDTTSGRRVPDVPMFLILDDAVSPGDAQHPGWPGYVADNQKFPVSMAIASVKVAAFKDIPKPTPMPLEIGNLIVSDPHPKPGQLVELSAELRVGNSDLGSGKNSIFAIRKFDASHFDGVGSTVDTAPFTVPELKAGRTYHVSTSYLVSNVLAPGSYSVGVSVAYTDGPAIGQPAGRRADLRQGGLLTVGGAGDRH